MTARRVFRLGRWTGATVAFAGLAGMQGLQHAGADGYHAAMIVAAARSRLCPNLLPDGAR